MYRTRPSFSAVLMAVEYRIRLWQTGITTSEAMIMSATRAGRSSMVGANSKVTATASAPASRANPVSSAANSASPALSLTIRTFSPGRMPAQSRMAISAIRPRSVIRRYDAVTERGWSVPRACASVILPVLPRPR